jgi:hypothetical protein
VFAYGWVEYFLIIDDHALPELLSIDEDQNDTDTKDLPTETLTLVVVSPIPSFKQLSDCNLITYKLIGDRLGQMEIIDVDNLVCLVRHVKDHAGNWYVVDQMTIVGKVDFVNSVMDPN